MLKRFLEYSLRNRRPIKVVWMEGGSLKTGNLQVVALQGEGFSYLSARNKKTAKTLTFQDVLAASYARGDDGDLSKSSPPAPAASQTVNNSQTAACLKPKEPNEPDPTH